MTTFSATLGVHIGFGSIALLSGALALCLKKGSRSHRHVGIVFGTSMIAMGLTGIALALMHLSALFIMIGVLSTHLAATGWRAARRRTADPGRFEHVAFMVSLLTMMCAMAMGVMSLVRGEPIHDAPAALYLALAGDAFIFAYLDLRLLMGKSLTGTGRIADHVWRMIVGLIFAAFALFVANPQVFPDAWPQPLTSIAPLAVLAITLVYWMVRVLRPRRGRAPSPQAGS